MRPGFDLDGGDAASTGGAFFLCTETWPRCFVIKQVFWPSLAYFARSVIADIIDEEKDICKILHMNLKMAKLWLYYYLTKCQNYPYNFEKDTI